MNDSTLVHVAPRGHCRNDAIMTRPGRRLTLLSAAERRYCEPLLRGFAERHPEIDVDFVFGISTDLHRRYLQEAASGGATSDLIWSSAMDQVMELVLSGHAQPHGVRHSLPFGRRVSRSRRRDHLRTALHALPRSFPVRRFAGGNRRARSRPTRNAIAAPLRCRISRRNGLGFLAMLRLERGSRVRRFPGRSGIVPAARRGLGARVNCRDDGRSGTRNSSARRLCFARRRCRSIAAHCAVVGPRHGSFARGVHSAPRGKPGSRFDVPCLSALARRTGGDRRGWTVPYRGSVIVIVSDRTDPARRKLHPASRTATSRRTAQALARGARPS